MIDIYVSLDIFHYKAYIFLLFHIKEHWTRTIEEEPFLYLWHSEQKERWTLKEGEILTVIKYNGRLYVIPVNVSLEISRENRFLCENFYNNK